MNIDRKEIALYVTQALAVLMILVIGLDLRNWRFEVPLTCKDDALHYLAVARSMLDNGSWWHIQRLSAPYELPMVMFPFCGTLEFWQMKLFALFLSEPGEIVTGVYLASFVLTGLSSCWCLRLLGFSRPLSALIGLLYAFQPFAFYRNTVHLMLVYYLVPIVCTAAIVICCGTFKTLTRSNKIILCFGTILVGLNYIYTAFFGCFLLATAALWGYQHSRRFSGTLLAWLLIVAIGIFSLANVLPSVLAWKQDAVARGSLIGTKSFTEADTGGLKLRHLLTPLPWHPVPAFRSFANQTRGKYPLDNENMAASLGAFGSAGFLCLLSLVFFGTRTSRLDGEMLPLKAAAALCLASLLLATIGGFGSLFNFFVTPEIRCYNRISVYIAFLSLLGLAYPLRYFEAKFKGRITTGVYALILVLGYYDQMAFVLIKAMHGESEVKYEAAKSFVQVLEQRLPRGASVYQLPYVTYPNTPGVVNMTPHSHLLAYVVSKNLRWSWPSLSGTAIKFNEKLNEYPPQIFLKNLEKEHFAGIWINRAGFADGGEETISQLEAAGGTKRVVAKAGAYVFVPLFPGQVPGDPPQTPGADRQGTANGASTVAFGEAVDFSAHGQSAPYLERGWSVQEPGFRWTEGRQASLVFAFTGVPEVDVTLTARAFAVVGASHPALEVRILANGVAVGSWSFSRGQSLAPLTCRIPHELFRGDVRLRLTFDIDAPVSPASLGVSGDARLLGIAVQELRFDVHR